MRARNIKPDFFRDYDLCTLDIYARVLFAGLWCLADREGRMEDCPPRIRADVFPYDNTDVEKLLESLAERGFIVRYTVEGDPRHYIQIKNFLKHQNPHKNEKPSEIQSVENSRVITGDNRVITGANRADSLIPDSLIPDSNKPIVEQKTLDVVREVISYLNEKSGKSFKASARPTVEHIAARIKEGHSVEDFKAAIDNQCREWVGTDMEQYLRPATLFIPSKFDGYVNNSEAIPRKPAARYLKGANGTVYIHPTGPAPGVIY